MVLKSIGAKINLSIIAISTLSLILAFFILFYFSNQIETQTYKNIKKELQDLAKYKIKIKKQIGLSNAIGISNDSRIRKSLQSNDRKLAIISLKNADHSYKKSTSLKNIKIHLHTKNNISFVRGWKLNKWGDDLSGFRDSVVIVNSTQKSLTTFEVGNVGLVLRAVVPVYDIKNTKSVGSLELIQGLDSVAKSFKKIDSAFLLLMDESMKKKPISQNRKFKNYGISQKFIDQHFLRDVNTISMQKLFANGYILGKKYFITYIDIKDFKNKKLGIVLLGKPIISVNTTIDNAQHLISVSLTILILMSIIIVIVSSMLINKLISSPLEKFESYLLNFFDYLNKESSDIYYLKENSNDEIGLMIKVINKNINKTKKLLEQDQKVIDAVKDAVIKARTGSMKQTITVSTTNYALEDLKNGFNDLLEVVSSKVCGDLNKISYALEAYQNLDFTHRLSGNSGEVYDGLNNLAKTINQMLIENKENGLTLGNNSNILLENVNHLNENSKKTNTSLKEAIKVTKNISNSIANNTENVTTMSKHAKELSISSNNGKDLAHQTTKSMNEIDEEVHAISDAIAVIDKIAFQTNILSLNASVEAAAAGESGKGFAVVAQEVRNLASKSSEASSEIKELVSRATIKAEKGKKIASNMIEGYSKLNKTINSTINLIKHVESSSKEQSEGIEKISNVIHTLEKQTTKNETISLQTQDVAIKTDNIAKLVVEKANEKKFQGKDDVKART